MAISNNVEGANRLRKHELIFALLKNQAKKGEKPSLATARWKRCRRFRLPALARHLLPRQHRRHLRQPESDPAFQPAHRRHDRRRNPYAQGRRALFCAGQGRQDQRRTARGVEEQDPLREPDAAAPGRAPQTRARHPRRGEHHQPHRRHHRADRQRPARPARRQPEERQDGDDAAHRARHHDQPSGRHADRPADRRAPEEKSPR
jgi:hypothetical protein